MSKETGIQVAFDRSAAIFMASVCAISLLAGAGWLFNRPILASLRSEYIPMAPANVFIFLGLCGVWLIYRYISARRGMRMLIQAALFGMLIVVIMLALRYFTGLGPDLEKLLYPAPPLFGQFTSARMSPLSALGFLLAIPAFLLMIGGKQGQRIKSVSAALSLALFVLSGIIILGYVYGAPPFYGGTLIPMALTSAISFWFLSLGLLLMAGPDCWPVRMYVGPSLRARLMRAFIPASIFIALFQALLSTVEDPWIINPAIKAAVAALVACLIVLLLVFLIANNLGSDIERGRKAEQALLRSEAKLRALFASMHDVVLVIGRDGVYREIAPTNPEFLVKPPKELLGKTLRDVFPLEQAKTFLRVVQQVLDTKQTTQIEYDLIIGDQTVRFETSISPMTEDSTLWVAHDITKRKQAEAALTDERNLLRTLIDNLPDYIYVKDTKGHFILGNMAVTRQIGLSSPDELVGKSDIDLFSHEIAANYETLEQEIIRSGLGLYDYEGPTTDASKENKNRWISTTKVPIREAQGKVVGTVGIGHDITERKQAEQAQQQSESLFRALFEASPDAVMLIDPHDPNDSWPIIDCNTVACVMNGYDREELIGHSIDILNKTPVSPTANSAYLKQIRESGNLKLETFHRHKNGTIFPIEVSTTLIQVGERELLMGIDRDITERKRMEEEIRSLSLTDELTGLYNRRGFTLLAEQEMKLARREKRRMLLFFGDMDGLKVINDTYGHAQGDLALQDVSAVLRETFREADILARIGGDEFVVLAVDASMESTGVLTNRIQDALEKGNPQGDRPYQLTISLGIARYDPGTPCTVSELITQADGRMYQQKQARKGKQ